MHRDALAVPQHTQLFQRLGAFQRCRRQRRKAAQEAGAVGVQADVPQRQAGAGRVVEPGVAIAPPGIGARLKYSARPAASSTTFTTLGLRIVGQFGRWGAPRCS
jgi:hypothetical protein